MIAVGSELLRPDRVDRNTPWLKERLLELGIPVVLQVVVPDDDDVMEEAMAAALRRCRFVFVTGGLGPTSDDRTRFAAARVLRRPLEEDAAAWAVITARFRRRGFRMPKLNRVQALIPEGAEALPNRAGTAPGILGTSKTGHRLVLLPGPPAEMQAMFQAEVAPRLEGASGVGDGVRTAVLRIGGLPESVIQERISDLVPAPGAAASLSILPSAGEVELRVAAPGAHPTEPQRTADRLAARLGDAVFTRTAREGIEHAVGRLLAARGERVALAESLTGGMIGARITRVPGSSRWFDVGFVTYANSAKEDLLDVPPAVLRAHGAVSRETAEAMARGARRRSGNAWSVAVTGIAGPGGGTPTKRVGLVWIAVVGPRSRAACYEFPGDRRLVRRLSATWALDLLRRALLEANAPG